jgi:Uma2 family endonuclease
MTRVLLEDCQVHVPSWVIDLESFRRWSDDDAFPEQGQFSFLDGEVWIDMSKEQLYSHTEVKTEINTVLRTLVKTGRLGRYLAEGAFVSNAVANVSNQPDGVFVSTESVERGRVRSVEGKAEGHVELEGSPDMVLEVVSPGSVEKDTEVLRQAYATAAIREYWLVDARKEACQFNILHLNRRAYTSTRKRDGWARSNVFGRWFRLVQGLGTDGYPEWTLDSRNEKPI